jgi:hypothetical protein
VLQLQSFDSGYSLDVLGKEILSVCVLIYYVTIVQLLYLSGNHLPLVMIYKNKLVTLKNLILKYRVPVKCQKKRETKYTETERTEMKHS